MHEGIYSIRQHIGVFLSRYGKCFPGKKLLNHWHHQFKALICQTLSSTYIDNNLLSDILQLRGQCSRYHRYRQLTTVDVTILFFQLGLVGSSETCRKTNRQGWWFAFPAWRPLCGWHIFIVLGDQFLISQINLSWDIFGAFHIFGSDGPAGAGQ